MPEDRDLDYKRDLDIESGSGRRDLAADVAAMANTVGGILVYGVDEYRPDGKSTNLPGGAVGVATWDPKTAERIENTLRDLIRPSLPAHGLDLIPLPALAPRPLLVIRVRRSVLGPHMVDHRVHARNSGGSYRVEVEDLRRMILEQHETRRDLDKWLRERSASVPSAPGNRAYFGAGVLCVRALPLFNRVFDVGSSELRKTLEDTRFRPGEGHTFRDIVYSAEGVSGILAGRDNTAIAALRVLRGFGVEWVSSSVMALYEVRDGRGNVPTVGLPNFATETCHAVQESIRVLKSVADPFPVIVQVSLHGASGRVAHHGGHYFFRPEGLPTLREDPLASDALVWPTESIDVRAALRPLFDFFWQALGEQRCDLYDESGASKGKPSPAVG